MVKKKQHKHTQSELNASARMRYKKFVDAYIETNNQTRAAIAAGYSEKTAANQGCRLLKNDYVLKYLDEREKELDEERIAKPREVMRWFTSLMRGQVKDAFDLPPGLSDRIEGAKALQKRWGLDKSDKPDINKIALVDSDGNDKSLSVQIYIPDNGRDGNTTDQINPDTYPSNTKTDDDV